MEHGQKWGQECVYLHILFLLIISDPATLSCFKYVFLSTNNSCYHCVLGFVCFFPFSWPQYLRNTLRACLPIWHKCPLGVKDGQRSLWPKKNVFVRNLRIHTHTLVTILHMGVRYWIGDTMVSTLKLCWLKRSAVLVKDGCEASMFCNLKLLHVLSESALLTCEHIQGIWLAFVSLKELTY